MVATSKKQLGIYLNDSEKGFIIVENLNLTDLINYVKLDDDGNIYILLESNKENFKTYNPDVTIDDDKEFLYYRMRICPQLKYSRGKDYWFKIDKTTERWKPKFCQTAAKKAASSLTKEKLTDEENKILDLNEETNYTGYLENFINRFEFTSNENTYRLYTNFGDIYKLITNTSEPQKS